MHISHQKSLCVGILLVVKYSRLSLGQSVSSVESGELMGGL